MDQGEAIRIAEEYVKRIEKVYAVKRAFLFGSFAKGTNHVDSDIDIAVVLDSSDDILELQIAMMKLRRSVDLRIEPHPFTSLQFQNTNPVANEIMSSGIEIRKKANQTSLSRNSL
ncbi:nucleotidyltransferase domain-containing protein [Dyadobacter sediminis]|uniref:Nucleotidyltransferase domain-containing protein n=1 Tax=Dyadobacter sediminis TaxID=1493691 RepID=A0A5R9K8N5_9BACT|nr:nucleotidyltransferase domain-containing protein [Dyadobacter sediminis]TLU90385.1 nucleotidyltransferase domain-containing protein [Dyadobacter sediminis]GGC07336.1 hypothetical protein GCM10011325_37790 [Dyadobacter sediminis]